MTVAKLLEIWIECKKIEIKKTSLSTYMRIIESNILPDLGSYNLGDITTLEMSRFVTKLMNVNNLSSKTVIDIKVLLQNSFDFAYKQGFFDKRIEIPTPPHIRPEVETFTTAEQKNLINDILSDLNNRNFLIILALSTGMRIGELCALKYADIKSICMVKHTVQRIKNLDYSDETRTCLHIGSPKSKRSLRPVPLNKFILNVFQKLDKPDDDCYILTNTKNCSEPRALEKYYEKKLKECRIEYKKFHVLRHTFATNALRAGVDLKTLAEIMGITENVLVSTYIHTDINEKIKSMEKLQLE